MSTTALIALVAGAAVADSGRLGVPTSSGQLVYVSAYSNVYTLDAKRKLNLSVTLSIRNTDLSDALTVQSVRYYNSGGALVREYVESAMTVPPLATLEYVVDRRDDSGGSGANFLVDWSAEKPVSTPIIETLMVSAGAGANALAFARSGQIIQERTEE